MRKAISLVLSAIMLSSSVVPVFADKGLSDKRRQVQTIKQDSTVDSKSQSRKVDVKKQSVKGSESTSFAGFAAYTDGNGVWLSWQMEAEVGNLGFFVYRVGKNGTELLAPTKGFIPGAATHARETPAYGQAYSYFDRDGTGESAYYLEAIALKGKNVATNEIYPQYIPDLRVVAGLAADQLDPVDPKGLRFENALPNYTKELLTEISENALPPDPVTHRTVISQPGVVRIGVKGEGLYRVPRAQLQTAGFDVNSDSTNWQLYVDGIQQGIIIGPNADYIEFYGKGTDTVETDIRKYFLLNGSTPGKRIENRVARQSVGTVVSSSYNQTFVKKERTVYLDDIINGPAENYFGRGFLSANSTLNFNLSGVDFTIPAATIRLRFQGYSQTAHAVEVTLNDQILGTQAGGNGEVSYDVSFTVPTSLLREGANAVKFRSVGAGTDVNFFDSVWVDFARKYTADANRVLFYTPNSRIAKLDGFTSPNVRVFDLTYESSPLLMTNLTFQSNGSSFGVNLPAARGRVFYAVEDSAVLAPESVTSNDPELLGIPTAGADLIIISHKDLLPQAQTWAAYRTGPNTTVKIVEVSEIYDEFNYGSLSSDSIRSFLQYAYGSWANPPEYVMLLGDASFDSRNYEGLGNFNMVPPKIVGTVFSETASDEALADFNGNGLAEISIGRISARTGDQATIVFNKVVAWEGLPGNWLDRGAAFAFDHDSGYPFSTMSQNLRNQIPTVPATMVYRGEADANNKLVNTLNTGKYIVNYSGHGTAGSWGGSPTFFNSSSVETLSGHNPSIYTMLTCLNGYFQWLYNPSMAEVLLFAPNKGAVIAWASTGLTTPDIQETMALRFYQKINEGSIPRIGDLVKDAKTVVPGGSDVRLSWVLLGDPMTKVR